ncbi:MAG TPA: hypothetical protein VGT04_06560 [Acidobacteriaceae bacterium]|nr:hypothetical protein [Acidobacteriaceae bacterium]
MPNKTIKTMSWHPDLQAMNPALVPAAFQATTEPSIVGMWHVVFTANTQDGVKIPGGAVIDNAVSVWHSDGTEIMNSDRAAQDGNFCLGVWKQTGAMKYKLNHIPWQGNVADPTAPAGTIGPPEGGAQIIENITLSPTGNYFYGSFTLTAYDTQGNVTITFAGALSGSRITTETPFRNLMQ